MGVTEKVRIAFELDKGDAQALCETLCEPKPSTAAAQVVRRYIRKGGEVIKPRDIMDDKAVAGLIRISLDRFQRRMRNGFQSGEYDFQQAKPAVMGVGASGCGPTWKE